MTGTSPSVSQIQERFDLAELHADRETLQELIDAQFLSIGPKGFLLDKQQWIDRHDFFSYQVLDVAEVDVRVFGDAAIVREVQRNQATSHGRDVRVSTRVSHVWLYREGDWRLAGIQFSPLAES